MGIYENPLYYDVAFSFRDIGAEVDFFEDCIRRFSKRRVRDVLELACGPCPYMLELVRRGYRFVGLDISEEMLAYSRKKAEERGISIDLICADMINFRTGKMFDFAFCMLGSIYAKSNLEFLSHLDSVANCLRRGALYLIEGSISFNWVDPSSRSEEKWTIERGGIRVTSTWRIEARDPVEQTYLDHGRLEVEAEGASRVFEQRVRRKAVFPQEFLELVRENGRFEFVGWFNDFDLNAPLGGGIKVDRPKTILRKR